MSSYEESLSDIVFKEGARHREHKEIQDAEKRV